MWRDFQYGWRALRKNRASTVAAIAILALGIGGNTAMFTAVRAVLLQPLNFRDPGRLIKVSAGKSGSFTMARYREMQAVARSLSALGAFGIPENVTISGGGAEPEQLRELRVSANVLDLLGVTPVLGRAFLPEEDNAGAPAVALISAAVWERRFAGDLHMAGREVTLDDTPYTVVGVLPPGLEFPFAGFDVWLPRPAQWSVVPEAVRDRTRSLQGFARLKPNVTLPEARAEMEVLSRQYAALHPGFPDASPKDNIQLESLQDWMVENARPMLRVLMGAVGFVLLIVCANVASLLLARAAVRSREFAVRAALGAARSRIIRQLLAESLLLAAMGGALGVLAAMAGLRVMTSMNALHLPRAGEIHLDGWMLLFSAAVSVGTGLLFGLVPSLRASRADVADALRAGGERAVTSLRRGALGLNAHGLLVMAQVAWSIVLLIGAGLMLESFARLRGVDPGFQPKNLLTMQLALPAARYVTDRDKTAFFANLVERVEALPGVRGAAVAVALPTTRDGFGFGLQVTEMPPAKVSDRPLGQLGVITPGYFRVMGVPLRRGREFTEQDSASAPRVVVINERLARLFWPRYPDGPNPIGRHMQVRNNPPVSAEIVGISADVHEVTLAADVDPEMYVPYAQLAPSTAYLAVRTAGDPMQFVNSVRGQVMAMDRDQAVSRVRSMDQVLEESLGQRRTMLLLEIFAGIALMLAAVGIYGAIAYSVVERTQELGIRRALGAQPADILRLVLWQGLVLASAGTAAGVLGALAATRALRDMLFEVSAMDGGTYAIAALVLLAVALAATYIPARRATRIDPMAAIR